MAAGRGQWLARPGQGAVYSLTFGLVGAHPLIHYAIQVVLAAAAAVLLYRLLSRLIEPGPALGVAALWVVLPNHASLIDWPSAVGMLVALDLLLVGGVLLTAGRPSVGTELAAAAFLAASMLCYEATAPAAGVAALVLPWLVHRRPHWRGTALAWTALAGAGAWMVVNWNSAKSVVHVRADLTQLFPAHFGWGLASPAVAGFAAGALGRSHSCGTTTPHWGPATGPTSWRGSVPRSAGTASGGWPGGGGAGSRWRAPGSC